MGTILLLIRKKLYLFVAGIFVLALAAGTYLPMSQINIKPVSMFAVFMMLYPMLTGMAVEKVKKAGRNYKLIVLTLFFAFIIASVTAYVLSRSLFASQPELALAIILVGAIPCSNMLIGWSGIADASVEDALVIAVIGLLLIPFLSPLIIRYSGGPIIPIDTGRLFMNLILYILVPLVLGYFTRRTIIKKKGQPYFMNLKQYFPGISATGILIIVFFSVAKVAPVVLKEPIVFLLVAGGLFAYYLVQTVLSVLAAKLFRLSYAQGMILILGATASSQAISLALAATMFDSMTVFALSFKPILQVLYIMFLIYGLGPRIKRYLAR
jgi:ACR3 family arsenite efflux pump ArsB